MNEKMRKIELTLTFLFSASFLVLALAITFVLTDSSNKVLQKNTAYLMAAESRQLELNINRYFEDVEETAALLFSDSDYYAYDATDPDLDEYTKIKQKEMISSRIFDIGLMQNFSDFGIIYSNDETIGWISQVTNAMFPEGGMYEEFSATIGDERAGGGWSFGHRGNYDRLYYAKRLNDNAIVVVSFYNRELETVFAYPEQLQSMTICLVDEDDEILYSTDTSKIGSRISASVSKAESGAENSAVVTDSDLITSNSCRNGWRVVCTIPVREIVRENLVNRHRTIAMILVIVLVILVIGLAINYLISRSVKSIVNNLSQRAEHDQMTGLLNKADFQKTVSDVLDRNNQEMAYSFVMLDLDNFKKVNDTLGHAAGDRVIIEAARIIRVCFGDQYIIGRIGGDEFAVFRASAVFSADDLERNVCRVMEGLFTEFDKTFEEERERCMISVSAGCVNTEKGNYRFDVLYKRADQMLYKSKKSGKGKLITCRMSADAASGEGKG